MKGEEWMEDITIVELFLKRDEQAIKLVSDKYGKRLRNISFGILNDEQASMECENDTYFQAWNLIPPNEPKNYLFPFLARIIRNISLNYCRKENVLKRKAFISELTKEMEECLPDTKDVETSIDDILLKDAINGYLSTLDDEKRNIFLRRYFFLDSIDEIAKRYLITNSKVKMTLLRCRKKLKAYLEKEGYSI